MSGHGLPAVCPQRLFRDNKGKCIKIIDPCDTDDNVLNSASMQAAFKNIWEGSNALDTSVPMADRLEQGGWIVLNGTTYSFVPYPNTLIMTPCGIEGSAFIPSNVVGIVHSHPFYKGENTKTVCGKNGEKSYKGGPSDVDKEYLFSMAQTLGNYGLIGYVIDGNNIHTYNPKSLYSDNVKTTPRCGY